MIQSLEQISSQVESFDFPRGESIYIQKLYSSSYFICISLRMRGETKFLYIGRGAGNEGVWLSSLRVESYLRKIDKFLEYLRKHLGSSSFVGI